MLLDLMINHISRQSPRVPRLRAPRPPIAVRRPVHHPRQGLAERRPAAGRRRTDLPAQARRAVLDGHDRGDRRDRSGSGRRSGPPTGPSRSTSTSRPRSTRGSSPTGFASSRRQRRPDRPPRRGRLRHQEARHVLLHGRAGDLRVPRLGDRASPTRSGSSSCPRSTTPTPPTTPLGPRLLDLRLRAARARPPRVPDRRRATARRTISPARPSGSSRRSTATTASRSGRTSTGSSSPAEMLALAERVRARGGNVNRILSEAHADDVDVHQLNCTYYSALD